MHCIAQISGQLLADTKLSDRPLLKCMFGRRPRKGMLSSRLSKYLDSSPWGCPLEGKDSKGWEQWIPAVQRSGKHRSPGRTTHFSLLETRGSCSDGLPSLASTGDRPGLALVGLNWTYPRANRRGAMRKWVFTRPSQVPWGNWTTVYWTAAVRDLICSSPLRGLWVRGNVSALRQRVRGNVSALRQRVRGKRGRGLPWVRGLGCAARRRVGRPSSRRTGGRKAWSLEWRWRGNPVPNQRGRTDYQAERRN